MFAAPAPCAGNLLIVPSCDGVLYALNRRTGKPVWKFRGAGAAYHASAVSRGKIVFVGNDDGRLYAVNEVSGALRWYAALDEPIWANPLLMPGLVLAGTLGGHLFAVRRTDGAIFWRTKVGKRVYLSSPLAYENQVLVGTTDGALHAVDAESGRIAWSVKTGGKMGGGPVREEETLYWCTTKGVATAFSLRTRKPLWTRRLQGGSIYPPGLSPTHLFVGTGAGWAYALDRRTGEVAWRFRSPGRTGCCAVDRGLVFACSWSGNVHALSAADGEERWRLETGADVRGFPTILSGWLYIGSLDNSLYAVKVQ